MCLNHALTDKDRLVVDLLVERGHTGLWRRPHLGPFIWGCLQPEEGDPIDWTRLDQELALAQERGMHTVATVHLLADWDHASCEVTPPTLCEIARDVDATWGTSYADTCRHRPVEIRPRSTISACQGGDVSTMDTDLFPQLGSYRSAPCATGGWRDFLEALVERYDGDGVDDWEGLTTPIHAWEIGNEPDMAAAERWPALAHEVGEENLLVFSVDDAATYGAFLDESAVVIHETSPRASVLHGSTWDADHPDARTFWSEALVDIESGRAPGAARGRIPAGHADLAHRAPAQSRRPDDRRGRRERPLDHDGDRIRVGRGQGVPGRPGLRPEQWQPVRAPRGRRPHAGVRGAEHPHHARGRVRARGVDRRDHGALRAAGSRGGDELARRRPDLRGGTARAAIVCGVPQHVWVLLGTVLLGASTDRRWVPAGGFQPGSTHHVPCRTLLEPETTMLLLALACTSPDGKNPGGNSDSSAIDSEGPGVHPNVPPGYEYKWDYNTDNCGGTQYYFLGSGASDGEGNFVGQHVVYYFYGGEWDEDDIDTYSLEGTEVTRAWLDSESAGECEEGYHVIREGVDMQSGWGGDEEEMYYAFDTLSPSGNLNYENAMLVYRYTYNRDDELRGDFDYARGVYTPDSTDDVFPPATYTWEGDGCWD
ncbi:MAG: hypothetical protein GY884_33555 [Proteobacteria bacterium]|nr:hypothetical protein [Pseudomonadota bacterium]